MVGGVCVGVGGLFVETKFSDQHFQADQTYQYLFEKQNDLKFPNKAPGWHNKIILLKNFTPKRNNSFDGHIGQIVNSDLPNLKESFT